MELYAESHDSFRNCGTFVYACTPEEVEQKAQDGLKSIIK